jgi:hypothetical protein
VSGDSHDIPRRLARELRVLAAAEKHKQQQQAAQHAPVWPSENIASGTASSAQAASVPPPAASLTSTPVAPPVAAGSAAGLGGVGPTHTPSLSWALSQSASAAATGFPFLADLIVRSSVVMTAGGRSARLAARRVAELVALGFAPAELSVFRSPVAMPSSTRPGLALVASNAYRLPRFIALRDWHAQVSAAAAAAAASAAPAGAAALEHGGVADGPAAEEESEGADALAALWSAAMGGGMLLQGDSASSAAAAASVAAAVRAAYEHPGAPVAMAAFQLLWDGLSAAAALLPQAGSSSGGNSAADPDDAVPAGLPPLLEAIHRGLLAARDSPGALVARAVALCEQIQGVDSAAAAAAASAAASLHLDDAVAAAARRALAVWDVHVAPGFTALRLRLLLCPRYRPIEFPVGRNHEVLAVVGQGCPPDCHGTDCGADLVSEW